MTSTHEIRCEWIAERGRWSVCLECGEPAWAHANSDPLADIRATAQAMRTQRPGEPLRTPHPAQRRP